MPSALPPQSLNLPVAGRLAEESGQREGAGPKATGSVLEGEVDGEAR